MTHIAIPGIQHIISINSLLCFEMLVTMGYSSPVTAQTYCQLIFNFIEIISQLGVFPPLTIIKKLACEMSSCLCQQPKRETFWTSS